MVGGGLMVTVAVVGLVAAALAMDGALQAGMWQEAGQGRQARGALSGPHRHRLGFMV